jgi:hypothetical protein
VCVQVVPDKKITSTILDIFWFSFHAPIESLLISYLSVCVWCECGVYELCVYKLYLIKKIIKYHT